MKLGLQVVALLSLSVIQTVEVKSESSILLPNAWTLLSGPVFPAERGRGVLKIFCSADFEKNVLFSETPLCGRAFRGNFEQLNAKVEWANILVNSPASNEGKSLDLWIKFEMKGTHKVQSINFVSFTVPNFIETTPLATTLPRTSEPLAVLEVSRIWKSPELLKLNFTTKFGSDLKFSFKENTLFVSCELCSELPESEEFELTILEPNSGVKSQLHVFQFEPSPFLISKSRVIFFGALSIFFLTFMGLLVNYNYELFMRRQKIEVQSNKAPSRSAEDSFRLSDSIVNWTSFPITPKKDLKEVSELSTKSRIEDLHRCNISLPDTEYLPVEMTDCPGMSRIESIKLDSPERSNAEM